MTLAQAVRYVGRDTINRRAGLEVIAGVLTVAIATAITMLGQAFSTTALGLIEETIEPTRPVAGVIMLASSSGVLPVDAYDRIEKLVAAINEEGKGKVIDGWTPVVTSIQGRELPLLDHAGKELGKNASLWCVANDSPLLRPEFGFPLVHGATFTQPSGLRMGVLVNIPFLKTYLGYDDAQCLEAVKHPERLPKKLRLQFPPIARMVGSTTDFYEPGPSELTISGFFNERSYPDLIISIDFAARHYDDAELGNDGEPRGKFGTARAFDLTGLVDNRPLLPPANRPPSTLPSRTDRAELVGFPALRSRGLTPYSLVIFSVADWKSEGARDAIRERLDNRVPVSFLPTPSDVAALRVALDDSNLRAVARLVPPAKFSRKLEIHRAQVDDPDKAIRRYRVHDVETQLDHMIEIRGTTARLDAIPPWTTALPGKKLADSLVRVRKIVLAYSRAIQLIVVLLAACAVFLLATAHVLRKTRDIGMLLSLGASRATIFGLYLGQVLWIGLLGQMLGLVIALMAAPGLERQAVEVIQSFSEEIKLLGDASTRQVMSITLWVILQAIGLASLTTLLGASLPAARAALTDPLKSIGSGA